MPKYISGRSKTVPQSNLRDDRYRYLSVGESEPNLGDPLVGPSSIGAKPIAAGQQYIMVSVQGQTGERYWIPNQGSPSPVAAERSSTDSRPHRPRARVVRWPPRPEASRASPLWRASPAARTGSGEVSPSWSTSAPRAIPRRPRAWPSTRWRLPSRAAREPRSVRPRSSGDRTR